MRGCYADFRRWRGAKVGPPESGFRKAKSSNAFRKCRTPLRDHVIWISTWGGVIRKWRERATCDWLLARVGRFCWPIILDVKWKILPAISALPTLYKVDPYTLLKLGRCHHNAPSSLISVSSPFVLLLLFKGLVMNLYLQTTHDVLMHTGWIPSGTIQVSEPSHVIFNENKNIWITYWLLSSNSPPFLVSICLPSPQILQPLPPMVGQRTVCRSTKTSGILSSRKRRRHTLPTVWKITPRSLTVSIFFVFFSLQRAQHPDQTLHNNTRVLRRSNSPLRVVLGRLLPLLPFL